MSTRDIEATFADVLSGTSVSKSVVSRVTRCLSYDFEVQRWAPLHHQCCWAHPPMRNSLYSLKLVSNGLPDCSGEQPSAGPGSQRSRPRCPRRNTSPAETTTVQPMPIRPGGFSIISHSLAMVRSISFLSFFFTAYFLAALNSFCISSSFASNSCFCATQRS